MKKNLKRKKSISRVSTPSMPLLQVIARQNKEILKRLKTLPVGTAPRNVNPLVKEVQRLLALSEDPASRNLTVQTAPPPKPVKGVEDILHNPDFHQFTPEDILVLVTACRQKEAKPGEVIFKEGELGSSLFIIKSGEIKVYKTDVLGDVDIAILGPGTLVGEMALIDNKPRSANVKAAGAVVLLELTAENYHEFLKQHPAVAVKFMNIIMNILVKRLREATKKAYSR